METCSTTLSCSIARPLSVSPPSRFACLVTAAVVVVAVACFVEHVEVCQLKLKVRLVHGRWDHVLRRAHVTVWSMDHLRHSGVHTEMQFA